MKFLKSLFFTSLFLGSFFVFGFAQAKALTYYVDNSSTREYDPFNLGEESEIVFHSNWGSAEKPYKNIDDVLTRFLDRQDYELASYFDSGLDIRVCGTGTYGLLVKYNSEHLSSTEMEHSSSILFNILPWTGPLSPCGRTNNIQASITIPDNDASFAWITLKGFNFLAGSGIRIQDDANQISIQNNTFSGSTSIQVPSPSSGYYVSEGGGVYIENNTFSTTAPAAISIDYVPTRIINNVFNNGKVALNFNTLSSSFSGNTFNGGSISFNNVSGFGIDDNHFLSGATVTLLNNSSFGEMSGNEFVSPSSTSYVLQVKEGSTIFTLENNTFRAPNGAFFDADSAIYEISNNNFSSGLGMPGGTGIFIESENKAGDITSSGLVVFSSNIFVLYEDAVNLASSIQRVEDNQFQGCEDGYHLGTDDANLVSVSGDIFSGVDYPFHVVLGTLALSAVELDAIEATGGIAVFLLENGASVKTIQNAHATGFDIGVLSRQLTTPLLVSGNDFN
ncbi:MAG: right-handed parallel beta-helix repeat-containing protein, partial [Candidatus Gracilibacteria bacterium]